MLVVSLSLLASGCANSHTIDGGTDPADGGTERTDAGAEPTDGGTLDAFGGACTVPSLPCPACLADDSAGWCWAAVSTLRTRYQPCAADGTCNTTVVVCPHGPCLRAEPHGGTECRYFSIRDGLPCLGESSSPHTCAAGACVPTTSM